MPMSKILLGSLLLGAVGGSLAFLVAVSRVGDRFRAAYQRLLAKSLEAPNEP